MTWQKIALSVAGAFLTGAGAYYQLHSADPITAKLILGLIMGGLIPVGWYLGGFNQFNPANQPKSAAELLKAVQASRALPAAEQTMAARALGNAVLTESFDLAKGERAKAERKKTDTL